jgi:hypothetical protein
VRVWTNWTASSATTRSSFTRAAFAARCPPSSLFIFGPEITFRAQPHGTFKLLFNGGPAITGATPQSPPGRRDSSSIESQHKPSGLALDTNQPTCC